MIIYPEALVENTICSQSGFPVFLMFPCSGYREQVNGATAFADASTVYGSNEKDADALRTFTGGKWWYGKVISCVYTIYFVYMLNTM